jgi:hypothetical protein
VVNASRTVRDVTAGSGFELADVGTFKLRNVPGDWPLFAVVAQAGLGRDPEEPTL